MFLGLIGVLLYKHLILKRLVLYVPPSKELTFQDQLR